MQSDAVKVDSLLLFWNPPQELRGKKLLYITDGERQSSKILFPIIQSQRFLDYMLSHVISELSLYGLRFFFPLEKIFSFTLLFPFLQRFKQRFKSPHIFSKGQSRHHHSKHLLNIHSKPDNLLITELTKKTII